MRRSIRGSRNSKFISCASRTYPGRREASDKNAHDNIKIRNLCELIKKPTLRIDNLVDNSWSHLPQTTGQTKKASACYDGRRNVRELRMFSVGGPDAGRHSACAAPCVSEVETNPRNRNTVVDYHSLTSSSLSVCIGTPFVRFVPVFPMCPHIYLYSIVMELM